MNQLSLMPARVRIASELRKAIYAGEYKSGDELSLTDVGRRETCWRETESGAPTNWGTGCKVRT